MDYKIIVDSCGELTQEMKDSGYFESIPLSIMIENCHIMDDGTFDQAAFLKLVAESPECPKSSCPSPETYMEAYHCDARRIYVVTLSAELSGSFNSACLGQALYEEEYGDEEENAKEIHVFNSRSASVGETLIALKIRSCEEEGLPFAEVVRTVDAYIKEENTYFVLETLETLRKNGRLTGVKAVLASALNIKPVMGATAEGNICQKSQGRGMQKALAKMVDEVMSDLKNTGEKILGISHCNCRKRAEHLKEMLLARADFKDVILLDTGGISSLYAADGGVIVSV